MFWHRCDAFWDLYSTITWPQILLLFIDNHGINFIWFYSYKYLKDQAFERKDIEGILSNEIITKHKICVKDLNYVCIICAKIKYWYFRVEFSCWHYLTGILAHTILWWYVYVNLSLYAGYTVSSNFIE